MTAFTVPLGTNTHNGAVVRVVLDESNPFLRVMFKDSHEVIDAFLSSVKSLIVGAPETVRIVHATEPDSLDGILGEIVETIRDGDNDPILLILRADEKLSDESEKSLEFILRYGAAFSIRLILVANFAVGSRKIVTRAELSRDRDGQLTGRFAGDGAPSHFSFYPLGIFE